MGSGIRLRELAEKLTKMAEREELADAQITFCKYPRSKRGNTNDTYIYAVELCSISGQTYIRLRDLNMGEDDEPTVGMVAASIAAGEMTSEEIQKAADRLGV